MFSVWHLKGSHGLCGVPPEGERWCVDGEACISVCVCVRACLREKERERLKVSQLSEKKWKLFVRLIFICHLF